MKVEVCSSVFTNSSFSSFTTLLLAPIPFEVTAKSEIFRRGRDGLLVALGCSVLTEVVDSLGLDTMG